MAAVYEFETIEAKWQGIWEKMQADKTPDPSPERPPYFILVMFPYPSGKLHMGHVRNYTIGDILARFHRRRGRTVLHPIGWDSFGLPAENAAIERNIPPAQWTYDNINHMKGQLKQLAISYDWDREIATCHPSYYKWNQWLFIQMFKKGLAYQKMAPVNWCSKDATVLANEQVHDGKCWRCGTDVIQKELTQWFFKITDYAAELLEGHKQLRGTGSVKGWPEQVLTMQENWIGPSEGAYVDFSLGPGDHNKNRHSRESGNPGQQQGNEKKDGFPIETFGNDVGFASNPGTTKDGKEKKIRVFTTRPDTLFGATFMVLAPEHPLVPAITTKDRQAKVQSYIQKAGRMTKIARTAADREKTGEFTGAYATNPVNHQPIPIWIADYVLADYGTGAIMAVPAHDSRDFEFARKFKIPIIEVIHDPKSKNVQLETAYEGVGIMVNSGGFNGLPSDKAKTKITEMLEKKKQGLTTTTYKLRDWLLSRQRYWGTPIPIIYCPQCGAVPVKEKDLPVQLPENIKLTGVGESPLVKALDWVKTSCPDCGHAAKRETDTMDTFVDSSWYYARYTDPKNTQLPFDRSKADAWIPVHQYVGGIEHACMHLIYSRFFHKVMRDFGLISSNEPFESLLTQGMVTLGGSAMSKSKGNVVDPTDVVSKYGADACRLFILFAAPPTQQLEWSDKQVEGVWRFLNRVWRLGLIFGEGDDAQTPKRSLEAQDTKITPQELTRLTHITIKRVTHDIEKDFGFNTAISAIMELVNAIYLYPHLEDATAAAAIKAVVQLLHPFAPHICEELWERLGQPGPLAASPWPVFDGNKLTSDSMEIVIQINGKLKDRIEIARQTKEEDLKALALKSLHKKGHKIEPFKVIYIREKLLNFVVREE